MSDNTVLGSTTAGKSLSRRSFLKWSAALGGTTALVGGGLRLSLQPIAKAEAAPAPSSAQWVLAACWHNCGGRCANYALVQDGVVLRQKTDDNHPDSAD